jgi:D-alanyl-D-alanine carboxypeptidase/D-alanyl-D-alanine-endopeptidase (penicillin-binding protein 4)
MKRILHCLAFVAFLLCLSASARAELGKEINSLLSDKLFAKADVGIRIIRLGDSLGRGTVLFDLNPNAPKIPASNLKLITTAAALERLGSDFQFRTTLAGRDGDLALIGDGDPTFGDAELLKKSGWTVDTVFNTWAQALKSRGLTQVRNLYVDDSIFDQNFLHSDWPVDQAHKRYVPQVGGINLNGNCIDFYLTTRGFGQVVDYRLVPNTRYADIANACVMGNENAVWLSRVLGGNQIVLRGQTNASNTVPISVTIHDPPMFGLKVLAESLERNGIRVTGAIARDRTIRLSMLNRSPDPGSQWTPLAVHTTPLAPLLVQMNKESVNLYAESLCKRVGAAMSKESGSWENGTAAVGEFLRGIGVSADEFSLRDGSGMSRNNLISPNAMVKVLEREFHGNRKVFIDSLAIAGVDGTFSDRFAGTTLKGRVFGKSGYIAGVRSTSGFLQARDNNWYAFSILINRLPVGSDGNAKPIQDKIIQAIDNSVPSARGVAAGD